MFDDETSPFNWIGKAVGTAFGWLGENPDFTAQLLVGIGTVAYDSMQRQDELKAAQAMEERRRPKYAGMDNYTGQLTDGGGLLTNGLLARQRR